MSEKNGLCGLNEIRSPDPLMGTLCAAQELPFDIARVYYICGTASGVTRGHHAHRALEQMLICVQGKIEIRTDDGRGNTASRMLTGPSGSMYVGPGVWRTMTWHESGSILLVLASDIYRPHDYIRDYDEFLESVKP